MTLRPGPSRSTPMVMTYATAPLVTTHFIGVCVASRRRRESRNKPQNINPEIGTPKMPTMPPIATAQVKLLQSGPLPKELNDAKALSGERAAIADWARIANLNAFMADWEAVDRVAEETTA